MDFLHDILALPGSVSAGFSEQNTRDGGQRARSLRNIKSAIQPLRNLFGQRAASDVWDCLDSGEGRLASGLSERECHIQALRSKLVDAEDYKEWLAAATELDTLEGNNDWKSVEESAGYDVELVRARLQELDESRLSRDHRRILLLIRTALTRNLGDMGNQGLYRHSRVGTKVLIERYIESVLETIDTLVDLAGPLQRREERQIVLQNLLWTRQSFGRSALLLSGGGTFGMHHIGVCKTLFEARLLPRIISGASAGSIVCAVLCTKTDEEIPEVLEEFCYGDLAVFEKEGHETSVLGKAFRFMTKGALFDISNLVRVMKDLLGDITFQEAYNRTRRILNICVSAASLFELPRLLNYITSPNVVIWSAVAASCSVPLIFSAAQLLAKDPRTGCLVPWNQSPQRWIDGSVENDIPTTRLAEMFNVNHFIVSQVNPHVVPFLERSDFEESTKVDTADAAYTAGPGWMHNIANLAKDEVLHRMQVLAEFGVLPNAISKLQSVLSQRYSGDITILPKISYANFPRVLSNPTTAFMFDAMLSGERATWPKLTEIRNHCAIELRLDEAVHQMKDNFTFGQSQVDIRRLAASKAKLRANSGGSIVPRIRSSSHITRSREFSTLRDLPIQPIPRTRVTFMADASKAAREKHRTPEEDLEPFSSTASSTVASEHSDDDESADDTPPSPLQRLWPSTRQLFPHASQPPTPSREFRTLGGSSPKDIKGKSLMMTRTPSTRDQYESPSGPEQRYKQLFHGMQANPGSTVAYREDEDRILRRSSRVSLDLDISGTRGMMRRRKRSSSAGIQHLWPAKSM